MMEQVVKALENAYNKETKLKFIEEQYSESEASQYIVSLIFKKTAKWEKSDIKDIYDYDYEELQSLLTNIKPYSLDDAKRKGRYLYFYISWAIENSLRKGNINPLLSVPDEFYESTIDNNKKIHFTYDEIIDIVEDVRNAQDQALIMLMFDGIKGEEFKELIGLQYQNIDWNNGIININREDRLTGNNVNIDIKVSDRVLYFLERAHHAKTYFTDDEKNRPLIESNYILKNTKSPRTKEGNPVSAPLVYTRLNRLKDYLNLEFFSPNAIQQSGMIYAAYDLIVNQKKYNNLTNDLYDEIGVKFNSAVRRDLENNTATYNYSVISKVVSPEKLKEMYNIDVIREGARS